MKFDTKDGRIPAYALHQWHMVPLNGMLLLRLEYAVPDPNHPERPSAVQLALTPAQVEQPRDQLRQTTRDLRDEEPQGSA